LMGTTLFDAVATTGAGGTATGAAGTDFGTEGFTGVLALGVIATFGVGGWGLGGAAPAATGFLVWTGLFVGALVAASLDGGFMVASAAILATAGAGLLAGFLAAIVEVAVGLAIGFLALVAGAVTGLAADFLDVLVAVAGALAAVDRTGLTFEGALAGFMVLEFTTGLLIEARDLEARDLGSGLAVWHLSFGRAMPAASARECTGSPRGKPANLRSDANI
jgi:hypothetical protein